MELRDAMVKAEYAINNSLTAVKYMFDLSDDWYGDNYHEMLKINEFGFETDLYDKLVKAYMSGSDDEIFMTTQQITEQLFQTAKQING